jgi:hypothetical protein
VQYAAFNDLVEGYKVAFDTLVNSVVLPKPRLRGQAAADPSIPSDEVEKYANDYFSLTYPSNYSPNVGKPGKDMQFTIQFKAYRSDCYINIDILAAKKLTLEKVVDQNAKKINVLSKGNANIGGDRSIYLADVPVKGVTRRIYFVVKNDKIYRVIVTYASSMESSFLPAFQKSLASLHIK